jgi:hypothetical protein
LYVVGEILHADEAGFFFQIIHQSVQSFQQYGACMPPGILGHTIPTDVYKFPGMEVQAQVSVAV